MPESCFVLPISYLGNLLKFNLRKDGGEDCGILDFGFIFTIKHVKRIKTLKDVINCQLTTLWGILIRICVEWTVTTQISI